MFFFQLSSFFKTIDFDQVNDFDENQRKNGWVGFANIYLDKCFKESETGNHMDIEIYKKLIELDTKLGTTQSEQLIEILDRTTRHDIIKV